MQKINFNLIKDIITSFLIVFVIILLVLVVIYDKLSIKQIIPESEEYELSEEMQEDLNRDFEEEGQKTITTYSLDSTDLKNYEKEPQYGRGKSNPFEEVSEAVNTNTISGENSDNDDSDVGFYEDDGTK